MIKLSPKLMAVASSLVAGILWGAWTYYINKESPNVYISTLVQFLSSMVMTVIMSFIVVKTQPLFTGNYKTVLFPALAASMVAICILVVSHALVQTENLLLTVAGPAIVGFIYSIVYAAKIEKRIRQAA